jgi:hypothetical protein
MLDLPITFLLLAATGAASADCIPSAAQRAWFQTVLSRWEFASDSLLLLPPAPLPWIVLFDTRCTWHLAPDTARLGAAQRLDLPLQFHGRPVPAYAVVNLGMIRTPSGDSFPVQPRVYAAMADNLPAPYLVAALPAVFRADSAAARDTLLEERIASVLSHEIVHTRQLPALSRELAELRRQYPIPPQVDDNVVEREFGGDAGFREAFAQERDLLYRAAFDPDSSAARREARQAVTLIAHRRARFFKGKYAGWDRLEDAFLDLEGVGEWVRYALHRRDRGRWPGDRAIVDFIRGRHDEWVQDEGLGLYLLIDRLVPGWQRTLSGPRLTSPVTLLSNAVS